MATRNVLEEKIRLYVETAGDKELGALATQLSKLGEGSDAAAEQAQQLVVELQKLAATSSNIKNFTVLKSSITETGTAIENAKQRLALLVTELDRADKPTKTLQTSLSKAASEVEKLTRQQNRQQVELQKTAGALRTAGIDTDKLGVAYEKLQDEMGGFSKRATVAAGAMQRTAKDSKSAASGMSALDGAAKVGTQSLALIATKLTLVSGAATVALKGLATLSGAALFSGALRSAATLEDALSQVQAVAGATADEMVKLKDAAEQGGAATRFSSLEAAQGLGELARATGSAESAIAALPATLNLAQAAGLGVADAAQIITTTLTQYGLAADQASRVSDILAKAANTTTADVAGLGNALSYAAPLAKQLGLDAEQTVAIIGALADQGFRGERAGTALRNVFTEMQDPASRFAKSLRDLGIETSDFSEVIEELGKRGKLGQEALLNLDAAARPAITSLVNSSSTALRQLDTDLRNAAGSAEETARVMGHNLPGAVESIKDTFDRTRRSLVEPLLEPLREELFALSSELAAFAESPEFEDIKSALKEMFVEGAAAARELVENIDFNELAARIRTALDSAGETITAFKENLGTIVDTVVIVGRSFQLVFNSIQSGIFLLAASISKIVELAARVGEFQYGASRDFAKFAGVIDEGEVSLKEFAAGMSGVADEFGGRFAKNLDEAIASAQALADTGADAGTATAAGLGAASAAADHAGESFTTLATVTVSAKDALDAQAKSATGSATATSNAATDIESSADRVKKAFADLGISSQADLARAAESAKKNFDLIRNAVSSGEATAEDARRAFAKYAQAARAAVAESDDWTKTRVEGELDVLDAIYRVNDGLKDMSAAGKDAGGSVASGANTAASALDNLASSTASTSGNAKSAADNVEKVGTAGEKTGSQAAAAKAKIESASFALMGLSDSAIKGLMSLNAFAGSKVWYTMWNNYMGLANVQQTAFDEMNRTMDEQLAKLDPLNAELEKMRQQYDMLDDAQLRGGAEKLKRLNDSIAQQQQQALLKQQQAESEARQAREQSLKSGADTALAKPITDTLVIDWRAPSKSLATSASAAELEQADRQAALVAPRVLALIERSRSLSIRRGRRQ